jgi:hypothetical protein
VLFSAAWQRCSAGRTPTEWVTLAGKIVRASATPLSVMRAVCRMYGLSAVSMSMMPARRSAKIVDRVRDAALANVSYHVADARIVDRLRAVDDVVIRTRPQ